MFKSEALRFPPPPKNLCITGLLRSTLYIFRINCYTSDMVHHKTKKAFTLAEVLITLGIIGIVAEMTMPALIANYQERVIVSQLKKVYSTLSQADKMAEAEYADISEWPV